MYILSDCFLGNINNDNISYLKDNKFYYTNDGENYKCMEINKENIHTGTLTEFYCVLNLYDWIEDNHMLREFVEKEINEFYVKVNIDKFNKVEDIKIVSPSEVKKDLLVKPLESVFIDFSEKDKILNIKDDMTIITLKETINGMISNKEEVPLLRMAYNSNICFTNMYYRKDVNQFVFSNSNLITYYSNNLVNQL